MKYENKIFNDLVAENPEISQVVQDSVSAIYKRVDCVEIYTFQTLYAWCTIEYNCGYFVNCALSVNAINKAVSTDNADCYIYECKF